MAYAHVCSRMLTHADVCSRMAYAHVRSRMLTYAHVCARMRTYAHVCARMLTYAHVCSRMAGKAAAAVRAGARSLARSRTSCARLADCWCGGVQVKPVKLPALQAPHALHTRSMRCIHADSQDAHPETLLVLHAADAQGGTIDVKPVKLPVKATSKAPRSTRLEVLWSYCYRSTSLDCNSMRCIHATACAAYLLPQHVARLQLL